MSDTVKMLITGGVRSGKSRYAEESARLLSPSGKVLYIATAQAFDWEMEQRIRNHQARRPDTWDTYEGHKNLGRLIAGCSGRYETVLLDCVTIMMTNLLFDRIGDQDPDTLRRDQVRDLMKMAQEEAESLADGILRADCNVLVVTNEVGLGVVPDHLLGRIFRDMAGTVNQILARNLPGLVLMVSGIPMIVKDEDGSETETPGDPQ